MAAGELLLEVRCEEIPARMLEPAVRSLASRLFEELLARHVAPASLDTGFTPRRLTIALAGLPPAQPDRSEELIGPPVAVAFGDDGAPTPAAHGFARKLGVEIDALERLTTERGEYVGARRTVPGRATAEILAELLPRLLAEIPWPKTMRWGAGRGPWVRPVHGVLALLDGEVVRFEFHGVAAAATTVGHPVHSPRPFSVSGVEEYRRKLARRKIEVRFERRRELLRERFEAAAAELGGRLVDDPGLLDRLAAMCGTPGVVAGRFSRDYLELPHEVLRSSLRDHQSAFTVAGDDGVLPCFLTVMDRADDPAGRVRAGNEWVVAARLADARFFWTEDRKRPLAEHAAGLDQLSFHPRLGSYAEKTERIVKLVGGLCEELGWKREAGLAGRAAELLKADLVTEMVKEFTSLQGVVGGLYAAEDGHPKTVWQAIYDQYLPASTDDPVPRSRVGAVTGLADRIDTLVGIFGLGLVPTGSKDPFGLRRAAQGAVRIVLESGLALDLDLVTARAVRPYGDRLELGADEIVAALRPFFHDRVRHLLGLRGFAYDEIEAALGIASGNLADVAARTEALHRRREEPGFLEVVLAAKRIANIVKDAPEHRLDEALLREPAERALAAEARELRAAVKTAAGRGDWDAALRVIAGFAGVLERFFAEVLVMDENLELRHNRIALLQSIQRTLSRTARFTEMVVDRSEYRRRQEEESESR